MRIGCNVYKLKSATLTGRAVEGQGVSSKKIERSSSEDGVGQVIFANHSPAF